MSKQTKAKKPRVNAPLVEGSFQYFLEKNPSVQHAASFLSKEIPVYAAQPTLDQLYDGTVQRLRFFMSQSECQNAISFANRIGFTHVYQPQTSEYAFRDNDRLLLKTNDLAGQIWQRLQPFLPSSLDLSNAVGCNPTIKFYRYRTGQAFGCHVDESIVDPDSKFVSRYTLLVYLNDGTDSNLQGGETRFYISTSSRKKKKSVEKESVLDVVPQTGMILMHGHGEHCMEHEGARVTRGEKYVLRTDVMFAN